MKFVHFYLVTRAFREALGNNERLKSAIEKYMQNLGLPSRSAIQEVTQYSGKNAEDVASQLKLGDPLVGVDVLFEIDENDKIVKAHWVQSPPPSPSDLINHTQPKPIVTPLSLPAKKAEKKEREGFEEMSVEEINPEDLNNIFTQLGQILGPKNEAFWHTQGVAVRGTKTPDSIKEYRKILGERFQRGDDEQTLELMQNLATKKLKEYEDKKLTAKRSDPLKQLHTAILNADVNALKKLAAAIVPVQAATEDFEEKEVKRRRSSSGSGSGFFDKTSAAPDDFKAAFKRLKTIIENQDFWHKEGKALSGTKTPDSIKKYRAILVNPLLNDSEKWDAMKKIANEKTEAYKKKGAAKRSGNLRDLHEVILKSDYGKLQSLEDTIGEATKKHRL